MAGGQGRHGEAYGRDKGSGRQEGRNGARETSPNNSATGGGRYMEGGPAGGQVWPGAASFTRMTKLHWVRCLQRASPTMPHTSSPLAQGEPELVNLVLCFPRCAARRNVQDQDLAAVQLLDVLGRGGQGVVFRGTLHGLETAVKVLTDGPAQQHTGNRDRAAAAAGGGDGGGGGAGSDGGPTAADTARRMRLVRGLALAGYVLLAAFLQTRALSPCPWDCAAKLQGLSSPEELCRLPE